MEYLTAEQAKQKADNSDLQYKILKHGIFVDIEENACQGKYRLEIDTDTTYNLATRLVEELKEYGYRVDFETKDYRNTAGKTDIRFSIRWGSCII